MNIIIKETQHQETLSIINPKTGVNFILDFVGNTGATMDGQFTYDKESNVFHCDQDTFDWWNKVVSDHQALEDRIAELKEEHGSDAVHEAIGTSGDCDLEDMASAINTALDDAFPVHSGN